MPQRLSPSLIGLAVLALVGCGRGSEDAAESASRLLAAAARGDRVAFEAEIDRRAVRDDLRRQLVEMGRLSGLDVEGGPSDFALDRMIGPDAVRLVAPGAGIVLPSADRIARQIKPRVKPLGPGRACLTSQGSEHRCLMTFAQDQGRWRLVGMQATGVEIPVDGG